MYRNLCMNCMQPAEVFPCPHCGYDPALEQPNGTALPAGTILHGKYLVGRVLGQGGFGITYVCLNLELNVRVAIKEFFPAGAVSRYSTVGTEVLWGGSQQHERMRRDGLDAFVREAQKMARVDSIPEIVRVREIFSENQTEYIVMDFVEGETLQHYLMRRGPLNWKQARAVFFTTIAAMEKVHRQGLIHRDLSPDNLILQRGGKVRILDLGAAKDLNTNSGVSSMQVAKSGFSPFEQYTQRGSSGPWSDVYAMAATMYYSLTGVMLPVATDRVDGAMIDWDHPRLQELPDSAVAALEHALAVSARDRTASMKEFLMELRGAAGPAGDPDPQAPEEKSGGKWLPVILIGLFILAFVISFAILSMRGEQSAPAAAPPATETAVLTETEPASAEAEEPQWKTAYRETLAGAASSGSYILFEYYLYDIELDGTPELFIRAGDSEAGAWFRIYGFDGSEAVKRAELPGSFAGLCGLSEPGQFLIVSGHQNVETIDRCTCLGFYDFTQERVFSDSVYVYHNFMRVDSYMEGDDSGLDWTGNEPEHNAALLESCLAEAAQTEPETEPATEPETAPPAPTFPVFPVPAQPAYPEMRADVAYVTVDELSLHSEPNYSSSRVGVARVGDRFEILEQDGEWYRNADGWVHIQFLTFDPAQVPRYEGTYTAENCEIMITRTRSGFSVSIRRPGTAGFSTVGHIDKRIVFLGPTDGVRFYGSVSFDGSFTYATLTIPDDTDWDIAPGLYVCQRTAY